MQEFWQVGTPLFHSLQVYNAVTFYPIEVKIDWIFYKRKSQKVIKGMFFFIYHYCQFLP